MWSAHFTSVSLPFTSRRRRERDTEWRALPVPFPSLSSFIRLVARFSPLATLPPAPSTHRRRPGSATEGIEPEPVVPTASGEWEEWRDRREAAHSPRHLSSAVGSSHSHASPSVTRSRHSSPLISSPRLVVPPLSRLPRSLPTSFVSFLVWLTRPSFTTLVTRLRREEVRRREPETDDIRRDKETKGRDK